MTNFSERTELLEFVRLAKLENISEFKTCLFLKLCPRTLQNWRKNGLIDKRKGSEKYIPRKLSNSEVEAFYSCANSKEFKDMNPYEIVSILAGRDEYIASTSTLYRILKAKKALVHRQESKKRHTPTVPTILEVTGSNQVWAWDTTWLKTQIKGLFLYAYTVIDLYDRTIVGWSIESYESEELAACMFERLCRVHNARPKILHADNGAAMRGSTLGAFLDSLYINRSHSRPRVSDDNAFIESWFKTLKYSVSYPKSFENIETARAWFAKFVAGYNNEHLHSSLGYVTPMQRRSGQAEKIYTKRDLGILNAFQRNPQRWVQGKVKTWSSDAVVFAYRPLPRSA